VEIVDRLVLGGFSEMTDEVENSLFEAGCDDGHLGMIDGVGRLEFDREAESLRTSMARARRPRTTASSEASSST
jgi:hypothetical protein